MKLHQKPHRRTKRESHASIMLGLAKSELSRLVAKIPGQDVPSEEVTRWHHTAEATQLKSQLRTAREQVEHWRKIMEGER